MSQRILAATLRSLERNGLVSRAMNPEVPGGEYTLTAPALTLRSVVGQPVVWSRAHLPKIDAARVRYDAQAPLRAAVDDRAATKPAGAAR